MMRARGSLVDVHAVDDLVGLAGVAEGGEGLLGVGGARADGGEHGGPRVTAQTLL